MGTLCWCSGARREPQPCPAHAPSSLAGRNLGPVTVTASWTHGTPIHTMSCLRSLYCTLRCSVARMPTRAATYSTARAPAPLPSLPTAAAPAERMPCNQRAPCARTATGACDHGATARQPGTTAAAMHRAGPRTATAVDGRKRTVPTRPGLACLRRGGTGHSWRHRHWLLHSLSWHPPQSQSPPCQSQQRRVAGRCA